MATLGEAVVEIRGDASKVKADVDKGLGKAGADADKSGRAAGSKFSTGFGGMLKGIGPAIAGVMAAVGVKDFLGDALGEARESQKVGAITANVIKQTGSAAKVTADQVGTLAGAISAKAGMDDEAIQSGANLILTFKNVRNEAGAGSKIFDRATQAAVDLSAAGFGSVESASLQLGKALNDPLKGIAALGRSGVTFTAQQKEQIKAMVKSGDVLGAQKIIMKEVESQVGGAAAASATAGDKAAVAMGNLKETIGTALLPVVDKISSTFTDKVAPAISTFVTGMQDGTGAGGSFMDKIQAVGDVVIPIWNEITGGIKAFISAWQYNDGEITSSGFPGFMEKIGFIAHQAFDAVVEAISGLVQGFKDGEGAGGVLKTMVEGLSTALGWAVDNMETVRAAVAAIVVVWLGWRAAAVVFNATQAIQLLLLKANTVGTIQNTVVSKTAAAASKAWAATQWLLNAAMSANPLALVVIAIVALVAAVVIAYKNSETFREIVTKAWDAVKAGIEAVVTWFTETAWPWLRDAAQAIWDKMVEVKDGVVGAWTSIKDGINTAWVWVRDKVFGPLKDGAKAIWDKIVETKDGIVKAWGLLKDGLKAAWDLIYKYVFKPYVDTAKWLWDKFIETKDGLIKAWGLVRDGLSAGWTFVKDKVFTPFKAGLGLLVDKFEDVKTGIKKAWDGLQAIAKAPVKFVIDTVLNKGLIGAFNWISGKIGGPTINPISVPGFAGGGVLPGYTPGRDVHRFVSPTGGRLDLSGGEAIMRPEFTRAVGGAKGVARLNSMARKGMAFANGGVFGHQSFSGGGILNALKGAGSWIMDKASAVFKAATNPAKFFKDKLASFKIPGSGDMAAFGKATVSKTAGVAVDKVTSMWKSFKDKWDEADGGGSVNGSGMGWRKQVAWARQNVPWAAITSTVRNGNPQSDHDKGRAIDLAGADMHKTFQTIKRNFSIPSIRSLYHSQEGNKQVRFGKISNTPPHIYNTHFDHVHWAMKNGGVYRGVFDTGGTLRPGLNVVRNNTGRDEHLVRADRAGSGLTIENLNFSIDDLAKIKTVDDFIQMLTSARVQSRKTQRSGTVNA